MDRKSFAKCKTIFWTAFLKIKFNNQIHYWWIWLLHKVKFSFLESNNHQGTFKNSFITYLRSIDYLKDRTNRYDFFTSMDRKVLLSAKLFFKLLKKNKSNYWWIFKKMKAIINQNSFTIIDGFDYSTRLNFHF